MTAAQALCETSDSLKVCALGPAMATWNHRLSGIPSAPINCGSKIYFSSSFTGLKEVIQSFGSVYSVEISLESSSFTLSGSIPDIAFVGDTVDLSVSPASIKTADNNTIGDITDLRNLLQVNVVPPPTTSVATTRIPWTSERFGPASFKLEHVGNYTICVERVSDVNTGVSMTQDKKVLCTIEALGPPPPPQNLTACFTEPGVISVSWDRPSAIPPKAQVGYNVLAAVGAFKVELRQHKETQTIIRDIPTTQGDNAPIKVSVSSVSLCAARTSSGTVCDTVTGATSDVYVSPIPPKKLDSTCAGSGVTIGLDGLSCTVPGACIVLAERGFMSGSHHWEFTATKLGRYSWCGVSLKPPQTLEGWLGSMPTGFAVSGYTGGTTYPCFHAGSGYEKVPVFTTGDKVGFTLHCDKGTLDYFQNGTLVGTCLFGGKLKEFCGARPLYPAFGSHGAPAEYTNIYFAS
ncbi:hypothetical protein Pelo_18824 [Pelomyxa schiedti]|nr:hypothetical protein Pelo_18824 [Pelomyxa schiedti]